jgi:hypothetical protein
MSLIKHILYVDYVFSMVYNKLCHSYVFCD